MHQRTLRIATRQSPLALWQANYVGHVLQQHHPELTIELLPLVTSGDKFLKNTLQDLGGKGLFVKELEEALLDKRADLAVHSMKDLPSTLPDTLILSAICTRDNPFDALVSPNYPSFAQLPKGAVVGTSSLRRQAQLLHLRPDLTIQPTRGNIQTRLHKLHEGQCDALLLAVAGLERLDLNSHITEIMHDILPACGQGALGLECREQDSATRTLLHCLHNDITAVCVMAERHVNALLGGNCHVPVAVYCRPLDNAQLHLQAKVMSSDGQTIINAEQIGYPKDTVHMAEQCAQTLLAQGAQVLLEGHI